MISWSYSSEVIISIGDESSSRTLMRLPVTTTSSISASISWNKNMNEVKKERIYFLFIKIWLNMSIINKKAPKKGLLINA